MLLFHHTFNAFWGLDFVPKEYKLTNSWRTANPTSNTREQTCKQSLKDLLKNKVESRQEGKFILCYREAVFEAWESVPARENLECLLSRENENIEECECAIGSREALVMILLM